MSKFIFYWYKIPDTGITMIIFSSCANVEKIAKNNIFSIFFNVRHVVHSLYVDSHSISSRIVKMFMKYKFHTFIYSIQSHNNFLKGEIDRGVFSLQYLNISSFAI